MYELSEDEDDGDGGFDDDDDDDDGDDDDDDEDVVDRRIITLTMSIVMFMSRTVKLSRDLEL